MVSSDLNSFSLLTNTTLYTRKNTYKEILANLKKVYTAIKSSFGPMGLDKMCVNGSGDLFITNDGSTICRNLELNEPICNILRNLAVEQDRQVGDGTTTVVLLAYYLVEQGIELILQSNVEPSTVVNGYRMAFNEIVKFIREKSAEEERKNRQSGNPAEPADPESLQALISSTITSKILNEERVYFIELLSKLKNVNNLIIRKQVGGGIGDTRVEHGFIMNCSVAHESMNQIRKNQAKLFLGNFSLLREKMPITATVNTTDPAEINRMRAMEQQMTLDKLEHILASGCDLILLSGGMDEICIKECIKREVSVVRRVQVDDLRLLARVTDGAVYDAPESKASTISSFEVRMYGEHRLMYIECPIETILIRGGNRMVCDEMQRAINDVVQSIRKSGLATGTPGQNHSAKLLPGGGATETMLYNVLREYASRLDMREYIAIYKYGEALKEVVHNLLENAGLDGLCVFSKMVSQNMGVNIKEDSYEIGDNMANGVVEPVVYKLKAFKAATEAAIAILRIDEIIEFNE